MAEAGKDEQPKRCQCGFWGSPQTMNLCSKCYKEKSSQEESSNVPGKSSDLLNLLGSGLAGKASLLDTPSAEEKKDEGSEEKKESAEDDSVFLPEDRPVQKNRKKCWTCRAKLPISQQQLGGCKCGYTFCFLHRLPEQHSCIYNHKEGGRQEAMKNMVPASKKKMGRSFHRMDSKPE